MNTDVEKFLRFCGSDFGKKVLDMEAGYLYNELKGYENILHVGCGIGSFEERLSELNIIGLDSLKEMLEEARKRSNKNFVLGDAENLPFRDSSFDAVFYVATIEFINNYMKAIREATRVTVPPGKMVVMMLNPESEYFQAHFQRSGSYFKKVKHIDLNAIKNYISRYYQITKAEYFLGIKNENIFETEDKIIASLFVIVGKKVESRLKRR